MKDKKNIGFLITSFNSGVTLSETIESLIYTQHLNNASIIILDGGSSDWTKTICSHYSKENPKRDIRFRCFPDMHPAKRVNVIIEEKEFDYIFLCHSDDIYIPSVMEKMFLKLSECSKWAAYAQAHHFQHPPDASNLNSNIYSGSHLTYPTQSSEIFCEMPFWWAISWNTALLKLEPLCNSGIRLNPDVYKFSNDYFFNWQLATMDKIMTINIPSVITRHRLSADGPSNITALENEVKKIKDVILFEIGLSSFLGPKLLKKFKQLDYRYKAFHESEIFEDKLSMRSLCNKLHEFSTLNERLKHFGSIANLLDAKIKDLEIVK